MMKIALIGCLWVLPSAQAQRPTRVRGVQPVQTAKTAKAIAELETRGRAVSAREVPLNGASGGWEVDVHMPGQKEGWRCLIDRDSRSVHRKSRIPNPPPPRRSR